MSTEQDFIKTSQAVRNLTKTPTDVESVTLYALFKQSTAGDVNIECPAASDTTGKLKWDHWNQKKGMSKDDAKRAYITYANGIIPKYK